MWCPGGGGPVYSPAQLGAAVIATALTIGIRDHRSHYAFTEDPRGGDR